MAVHVPDKEEDCEMYDYLVDNVVYARFITAYDTNLEMWIRMEIPVLDVPAPRASS